MCAHTHTDTSDSPRCIDAINWCSSHLMAAGDQLHSLVLERNPSCFVQEGPLVAKHSTATTYRWTIRSSLRLASRPFLSSCNNHSNAWYCGVWFISSKRRTVPLPGSVELTMSLRRELCVSKGNTVSLQQKGSPCLSNATVLEERSPPNHWNLLWGAV